jgi:lipopolysaccharide export system protein LptC
MMRLHLWLPIAVLGALVALTFWLERQVRLESVRGTQAASDKPDIIIDNFNATRTTRDGQLQFSLKAVRMLHYPAGDTSRLEKVSFESQTGSAGRITATSDKGTVLQGGNRVLLEGNVVVRSAATEGERAWQVTTPRLEILPQENRAMTDAGVHYSSQGLEMDAASLDYDTKTKALNLKQVRAVYAARSK